MHITNMLIRQTALSLIASTIVFASNTSINNNTSYAQKRLEVVEKLSSNLKIPQDAVKKVSNRLAKDLEDQHNFFFDVDIFISDKPKNSLSGLGGELNAHATFTRNLETNQTGFTLNGKETTENGMKSYIYQQKQIFKTRNEYRKQQREDNLRKIAALLNKEKELSPYIENDMPYITLKLSRAELVKLIKMQDIAFEYDIHNPLTPSATSQTLSAWEGIKAGYLRGTSITQMHTAPWNDTFPNTYGENIGIYYSDVLCPATLNDLFQGYTPTSGWYHQQVIPGLDPTIDSNASYHTNIITGVLGTVATKVNLTCNSAHLGDDSNDTYYDVVFPTSMDGINIESYSLNRYKRSNVTQYSAMDALFDHHSFVNRDVPIFIAASNRNYPWNTNLNITSPAKAFNVITVGSYGRDDNAQVRQIHSDFSAFEDPQVGSYNIRKPEVSAPGEGFHYIEDNQGYATNGTSFATPWTAALAADVMSQGEYWTWSAAMIKAVTIAGASDPVSVPGTSDSAEIRDRVGEGGVDLFTMTWFITNSAFWWDENPNRPFTPYGSSAPNHDNSMTCFNNWTTHLYGGREQRIVIAWLNDVTNASELTDIPNEYSIQLLDSNGIPVQDAGVYERHQGYQILRTSLDGDYIVRVCQRGIQSDQRFDMGFAVGQRVDDESQWNQ